MLKLKLNKIIISLRGLTLALRERAFLYELVLGSLIFAGIAMNIILKNKTLIFVLYAILLMVEILNTAIEKLCNKITTNYDNDIRDIKDLGSSAVFIILIVLLFLMVYSSFEN
jgi:diacylglycerol kinase (ATP)